MIIGIGSDIIQIPRIEKILNSDMAGKFLCRIYSEAEVNLASKYSNKAAYYAKRWAAKEAFAKALGTGFRNGLIFKDITIINSHSGQPQVILENKAARFLKQDSKIHLTMSDDYPTAIAFVLISETLIK